MKDAAMAREEVGNLKAFEREGGEFQSFLPCSEFTMSIFN